MSETKTPFSETLFYPILFMALVSVVFVGILALMFRTSEAKIEAHRKDSYQRLVLQLCAQDIATATGKSVEEVTADYPEAFEKYIVLDNSIPQRTSFKVMVGDTLLARCMDIGGKGLWGTMRALVTISNDLSQIKDFAIYEQMETPGLGARIEEEWYRTQFRGKRMIENGKTLSFELIPEDQVPTTDNQLRKVTGATITSNSVIKMLTSELRIIYDSAAKAGDK